MENANFNIRVGKSQVNAREGDLVTVQHKGKIGIYQVTNKGQLKLHTGRDVITAVSNSRFASVRDFFSTLSITSHIKFVDERGIPTKPPKSFDVVYKEPTPSKIHKLKNEIVQQFKTRLRQNVNPKNINQNTQDQEV